MWYNWHMNHMNHECIVTQKSADPLAPTQNWEVRVRSTPDGELQPTEETFFPRVVQASTPLEAALTAVAMLAPTHSLGSAKSFVIQITSDRATILWYEA